MKQILQQLGNGQTSVREVPAPGVAPGGLLIATRRSLISSGTERMLVEFGRASLIDKARQQPEKVRQVLDKVRTDGPITTLDAVRGQLGKEIPLGYCNVGVVAAVGEGVTEFSVGERIVSNGPHAEVVAVPRNLCARVPDNVTDDAAAFTVLASIGLQGLRLAKPTIGESFVVTGLGLIGLLTVQLLRANGCRVLGIDPDPAKTALARAAGAATVELSEGEDPLAAAAAFSRGRGVDGVLITAATKSDEPVSQAAQMCRKRGRIVLVGVAGLKLNRAEFYEKELSFQVSCSYGPGRYDAAYEEEGHDYPIGFVRWTEQRNFEAVLDMMASGALDTQSLVTHRFNLADGVAAYDLLAGASEPYLGIMLEYDAADSDTLLDRRVALKSPAGQAPMSASAPVVAVIGAGNYASRVLVPAIQAAGAGLYGIVSSGGQTAASVGEKFSFAHAGTDADRFISDPAVNTVVVATRHDSHSRLVCAALAAGKNVFVEKPLALTTDELDAIEAAWASRGSPDARLMVGFNRRFAPFVVQMKALISGVAAAKSFVMTVNAGALPADHWTQQAAVGGGRIIGEACHFIDLMRFLAGAAIERCNVMSVRSDAETCDDKTSITLGFADGSIGTIHYLANGHAGFPKERIEVFAGGRILQIDNYRRLSGFGWQRKVSQRSMRQDKGQQACMAAFLDAVREGKAAPIAIEELLEVSRVTVEAGEAARRGGGSLSWT